MRKQAEIGTPVAEVIHRMGRHFTGGRSCAAGWASRLAPVWRLEQVEEAIAAVRRREVTRAVLDMH